MQSRFLVELLHHYCSIELRGFARTSLRMLLKTGLTCALLLFFCFFSTQTLYAASTHPDAETILSASEFHYPPFCTVSEEDLADGFSVELLRAALNAMGKDVSFDVGPWSKVKQSLIDKKVQVLPLVGRTPEREEVFDFTFPYMTMHGTIIVRSDTNNIKSLADLSEKRVAVMRGDNAEEFLLRSKLNASIVSTGSFEIALQNLSLGEYDAVVIQKLLATQLIRKNKITNLKAVGPPLEGFVQSFCFAVAKGDSRLLSKLNEGLSIVFADGTFEALRKKWFASNEFSRNRIVVGGDFNYPPYEFLDENGQPAGYNVELTKAIAQHLGLDVVFQLGPWGAIRKKLENNEIDLIAGMFYSAERDKTFEFTGPHAHVSHVAISRIGTEIPTSMANLSGKIIAVMDGDIMHDLAIKAGYGRQLVLAKTQQEALQLVSNEHVEFALIAMVPALYWIEKENLSNLNVGKNPLVTSEYCYASTHANKEIVEHFSHGLNDLKANGVYRAIRQKWLGVYEEPEVNVQTILKYSLIVIAPFCLIVAFYFFWTRALKKQVASRTRELQREISDRKQVEEQLQVSHKFEAIGQLAGGIAHDFNNLLTIIFGYSELIRWRYKSDVRTTKDLSAIVDAATRGENLTNQLLAFSRKQVLAPKTVDLNVHLSNFKDLLRRLLKENVQLEITLPENPVMVVVDPARLEQIIVNLVVNARDAIDTDNGNINITVSESRLSASHQKCQPERVDTSFGLITVEDTGHGIPLEMQEKIFEPFFTTKGQGKGTGLGLSTVFGIVKQSHGNLFVESQQDIGSRFSIYLPKSSAEALSVPRATPANTDILSGKTILVVDDEDSMLAVISQTLELFGCNVLTANSAGKAEELWLKESEKINLVITDVGMPKTNGIELAKSLLGKRLNLLVLFISGYGDFHTQKADKSVSELPFLQKPFTHDDLCSKICHVFTESEIVSEKQFPESPPVL